MKFGDNLQHLSIPEWKSYNLDYNALKYQIRSITQSNSSDLSRLHSSFIENFDYINLFIKTKYGELSRKFDHLQNQFNYIIEKQQQQQQAQQSKQVDNDNEQLQQSLIIQLDDLFYQTIELSIDIKNLSKFIIIQKIAIKKIFKKFLKYYPNKQQANKFIIPLKNYFLENLNVNLNELTLKLTNLINVIKYESKARSSRLKRNNSLFSISSTIITNSDYSNSIIPSPPQCSSSHHQYTPNQSCPTTPEACFDLNILLKKNFQLHCLANQDSINDLMINFNLYFQLKNLNDNLVSFTYLTRDYLQDEPAYIVSHNDTDASIIIAPIGGLRKYSYCILPNYIIQILMNHLNDRNNEVYKNQLFEFFSTTNPSSLTKKTVDYIVSNDLTPTLKLFCKRARYTLEQEDQDDDSNNNTSSSHKANTSAPENIDKDYMIILDSDIMTTNNLQYVNDLSFPKYESDYLVFDVFPHNHLAIFSNDINLCNFENDLLTEIDLSNGGIVKNQIGNIRKLPKKIQTIINNNSLTLFKGLNFYQYQLSCYHNIIPQGNLINNHYSNLLNLNLLKNFENIEKNNQQLTQEEQIIKQKSDNILKHKQSIQSLSISAAVPANNKKSSMTQFNPNSMGSSSLFDDNIIEEEPLTEEDENMDQISLSLHELINHDENLYLKKIKKQQRQHLHHQPPHLHQDSIIPSFFDRLFELKQKFFNENLSQEQTPHKKIHENPFFVDEDEVPLDPYTKLLSLYHTNQHYDSTYDSINEDPLPYLQRNNYQKVYEQNYDKTLSYAYFTLNLISIFLSGIQLGIFLSILQDMEYKFLIKDNVGIIVILTLGIFTSLIFCLISINLLFQRFSEPPMSHWIMATFGLFINLACWSWSIFLMINCI